jgi:membrane-associated protein
VLWLKQFLHQLTDVETLVLFGGLTAITAIVFAETGLMVGFFLPGDSLLVTAGVFAASGHLSIWTLNVLAVAAAILGDTVGYWIGRQAGPALFARPRSRFFNPEHLKRAHDFYERHGGKTIILARFMPIVRTFAPVVAGMGQMNYRRFVSFNVFGGLLWVTSMTLIGYYLGQFAWVRRNIEIVILIVVFLSILPGIVAFVRERWRKRIKSAVLDSSPPAPGGSNR